MKSINSHGKCIRLYTNRNCIGESIRVAPGSLFHGDLSNKIKSPNSISLCSEHDCLSGDNNCSTTHLPKAIQIGRVNNLVLEKPEAKYSESPIVEFQRRLLPNGAKRIEYLKAKIFKRHLKCNPVHSNSTGSQMVDKYIYDHLNAIRRTGGKDDVVENVIGKSIGIPFNY